MARRCVRRSRNEPYWSGQGEDARPLLEETLRVGHELADAISMIVALGYLAALDRADDDLPAAESISRGTHTTRNTTRPRCRTFPSARYWKPTVISAKRNPRSDEPSHSHGADPTASNSPTVSQR